MMSIDRPSPAVRNLHGRPVRSRSGLPLLALLAALALGCPPAAPAADNLWVGDTSANWADANWTNALAAGDALYFGTAGTAGAALSNNTAAATLYNGLTFNSGASAFAITGNAINLGAGGIANNGANLQTVNLALALQQGTTINAASGNLALGGVISGGFALTKTGPNALTLTGANTFNGGLNLGAGVGTVTGTVNATQSALGSGAIAVGAGSTLAINNLQTTDVNVNVNNTITGTGLLKLVFAAGTTARNSYLGGLSGFTGTIQLSNLGSTGDKWNAGNLGTINAALIIDNGSQLFMASGTETFANGITVTGTGNSENRGAIRLIGTLGGNISLAGSTTIGAEGGTLTGGITNGTAGAVTLSFAGSQANGNATVNGAIGDGGAAVAVTQNRAGGTTTLTGTNTYSGTTTISAGTLSISGAGKLGNGSYAGNIVNNGALVYGSTEAQTLSGTISGSGTLTKNTASALTLSGPNTYGGGTKINAGTVNVGLAGSLGAGAVTNDAILNLTATTTGDIAYTGLSTALRGTGTVNVWLLTGTSTRSLNGDYSNFTGTWNVGTNTAASGGKVQMNGADNAAATINVLSNATVFVGAGVTKNAAIILNGGNTGESLGQLRLEANANWAGPVTLAGNYTDGTDRTVGANSGTGTISGVIGETGGSRGLGKGGGGTTFLSGANTYHGDTFVGLGTLIANNALALQYSTLNHTTATFRFGPATNAYTLGGLAGTAGISLANTVGAAVALTVGGNTSNTTYSGALSGDGNLTKVGTGSLTLSGANSFSGGLTVSGGGVVFTNDNRLGAAGGAIALNGGTLKGGAAATIPLAAARTITLGAAGGYFGAGSMSTLQIDSQVSGSGFAAFDYDGTGTYVLTNPNNDYAGDTRIGTKGPLHWNDGSAKALLKLGAANALPFGAGKGNVVVGYVANDVASCLATLDLSGYSANINGLSSGNPQYAVVDNNSGTAATLTLGNGDATAAFGGVIKNTGAGALSLVKTGSGTQTLFGANTYAGTTTISNGTLRIDGTLGGGLLTVCAGATLSGTGTVGTVTVGTDGILAPGNSIGTLTVSNLTLAAAAELVIELGAPGVSDQVVDLGATSFSGLQWSNFQFSDAGGLTNGVYTLINGVDFSGASLGTTTNGTIPATAFDGRLSIDATNNDLLLTVVPEPDSLLLLALLGGGFFLRQRRRSR